MPHVAPQPECVSDTKRQHGNSTDRVPILVITAYEPGTGYTRVVESVFPQLADQFDVHVLGLGYSGPQLNEHIRVYPDRPHDDSFGTRQCRELIERIRPRLAVIYEDLWTIGAHLETLQQIDAELPTVAYCPVDGAVRLDEIVWPLQLASRIVTFTNFGRRDLHRVEQRLWQRDSSFTLPQIDVIPHGVDTDTFFPLDGDPDCGVHERNRLQARRRVFPDLADPSSQFIVLNANRNTGRKRIDLTIEGFARFARNKPDTVKLCLHHRPLANQDNRDVLELASRFGIAERLLMTDVGSRQEYLPDDCLNDLYNASNVGLNTSMGEGWGLVSLEHGATGAAQIVPRHTACAEIWDGSALLIEPSGCLEPNIQFLEMEVVDPADVADALERLYTDQSLARSLSTAAWQNATRVEHRWQHITRQWRQLLDYVACDVC